ncbi:MAG TPA: thymidine kinase [Candidatus Paceibacterota bacterium]
MSGHLEVICGPMFSGKTEEMLRRLRRVEIAGQKSIVFKPVIDNRYSVTEIASHVGNKREAYAVKDIYALLDIIAQGTYDVIAIDEVQFFEFEIAVTIQGFLEANKRVIVSGLDLDFRKEPFGIVPELLAMAKFVVKLRAVCQVCGEDAMYTQRLLNGKPAPLSGKTVIVGGQEQYEARCEKCWQEG